MCLASVLCRHRMPNEALFSGYSVVIQGLLIVCHCCVHVAFPALKDL